MKEPKIYTTIGLMSGTSLDGIDAVLVRTDGHGFVEPKDFISLPYDDELREKLRACLGKREDEDGFIGRVGREMTNSHAASVDWILARNEMAPKDIDLIGFHGQTIFHDPANRFTWQIGNGAQLAAKTSIDVVNDFRSADVAAGGQGAPLIPLYLQALASELKKPLCFLNIGGVANVTYLNTLGHPVEKRDLVDTCKKIPASAGMTDEEEILAFDTGPGNALLNDWLKTQMQRDYDEGGMLARQGIVHQALVDEWLSHDYFGRKPPKSLDRDAWENVWKSVDTARLSAADGAATLTAFTVQSIAASLTHLPAPPQQWYVSGGGRHNLFMMESLHKALTAPVGTVDELGWNGDALEAQAFAWLAVRSVLGLPLSLPSTTGVNEPMTGGVVHGV